MDSDSDVIFLVTKNEKRLMKKIYDQFLTNEHFSHIKLVFYTWLTDDYSIIYIYKYIDGNWTYMLADTRNPITDKIIVDIKTVLKSN